MITIIGQPVMESAGLMPRPRCANPECNALLTGWIEHCYTVCPKCGKVAIVKWQGNQLVVVKREANLNPHS